MNQQPTKDILKRFSCFLVGGEKRNSGHKILLESLFLLRKNNDLNVFSKDKIGKSENFSSSDSFNKPSQKKENNNKLLQTVANQRFAKDFIKIFHQEGFKNQRETIRQFLCLPYVSLVKDNEKHFQHLSLLKSVKQSNDTSLISNEKKTVMTFQRNQLFEKTLQKKVIVRKDQQKESKVDPKLFSIESILSKNLCLKSIENVKPVLETRKIRKGRMTYKVPLVTSSQRQEGKAISLLIENANFRKKNELKRSGSLLSDSDSTFHKIANGENFQNKNYFALPPLYTWQTAMNQPLTNTPLDKKFCLLPSHYQSIDRSNKKIVSNDKQSFSRSKNSRKEAIDKNIFLMLPEKKHFLSFLRKPNVKYCLSEELFDSYNRKGASIEKKKQLHNLALQNRAYQHFRWW